MPNIFSLLHSDWMLQPFLKSITYGTTRKFSPESPIRCLMVFKIIFAPHFMIFPKVLAEEGETDNFKALCFTSTCKKVF